MKLPDYIEDIYLSGFAREGIITALVDDTEEVPYKKLRSNSNIYNNPLVKLRIVFKEDVQDFKIKGRFGKNELRIVTPRDSKGELIEEDGKEKVRTSPLHRGKNVFTIKADGKSWDLVIYHKTIVRDWVEGLARAVILIVGLNTFVIQGSYIPSASMMNTLMEGDYIWVNKAAYLHKEPQRGDVVVFNFPLDPTRDFIKRLIAVPGDKVKIENQVVSINGKELKETFTRQNYLYEVKESSDLFTSSTKAVVPEDFYLVKWPEADLPLKLENNYFSMNRFTKTGETIDYKDETRGGRYFLPLQLIAKEGDSVELTSTGIKTSNGLHPSGSYRILKLFPRHLASQRKVKPGVDMQEFTVKENSYFVMGDNRNNSQDSRFWGPVERANLKGTALFLYFPFDRMKMIKQKFADFGESKD